MEKFENRLSGTEVALTIRDKTCRKGNHRVDYPFRQIPNFRNIRSKEMAEAIAATVNDDLQEVVYKEIQEGAAPLAAALNMPNMVAIDEGSLGDFPWYWQNGTNFNEKTYGWLNNVFAYNKDGYLQTSGAAYTTAYFNVLMDTAYVLDDADAQAYNNANLANATVVNTVITDWTTTMGAFPSGTSSTQIGQLNYIMSQVLTWGTQGLTLGQLRNSTNPTSLLPNIPVGANQIVNDLMTYLANTSSIANIQAAVLSANNQLAQTRLALSPAPASLPVEGWMQTSDDKGNMLIVPEVDIDESTANIQNNLIPSGGTGKSFSASFSASQGSSNTVDITASVGGGAVGDLDFFFTLSGGASSSLNIFSADSSQKSVEVGLEFNGVTTVTPKPYPYSITSGKGWWNPEPVQNAAQNESNNSANQSGYYFKPVPPYNFGTNGDFGFLSRILISQQPVLTLKYNTSNYSAYQETFKEESHWGISFLGIPLGGGSQSYYQAHTSYDSSSQTVTVTMTPVGVTTPVTATDQLAYVVGGEVNWIGAAS